MGPLPSAFLSFFSALSPLNSSNHLHFHVFAALWCPGSQDAVNSPRSSAFSSLGSLCEMKPEDVAAARLVLIPLLTGTLVTPQNRFSLRHVRFCTEEVHFVWDQSMMSTYCEAIPFANVKKNGLLLWLCTTLTWEKIFQPYSIFIIC